MKIAVVSLTKNGAEQACIIGRALDADIYVKNESFDKCILNGDLVLMYPFAVDFGKVIKYIFHSYDALILVMACGIAVRSIAPYIRNKSSDPAVVVVDEMGRFAISLLSGHIGGANRLAARVAGVLRGVPVITTSTDLNGVIAFDELAMDNDCVIENLADLKYISAALVNGGRVSFFCDCKISGMLPQNIDIYHPELPNPVAVALTNSIRVKLNAQKVLYLRPRNLIVGIGCKRGKTKQEIEMAVMDFLHKNGKSLLSVKCIASISIKANERGIADFCSEKSIPFKTLSAEEIKPAEHLFSSSEFVRMTTGVGSVAEACAVLAGHHPRLICVKTVYSGITLALAEEERCLLYEHNRIRYQL